MRVPRANTLLLLRSASTTASAVPSLSSSLMRRGSPATIASTLLYTRRPFATSRSMASAAGNAVTFSAGVDETALTQALESLLASAGHGGRWTLIPSGEGLERSFKFKNFGKTWDFMTAVSLQCKLKNHHPEWSNVYNTTHIRWTTHNPKGLSAKDVELARLCDALAQDFEEQAPPPQQQQQPDDDGGGSCDLKQVTDRASGAAGDCCGNSGGKGGGK